MTSTFTLLLYLFSLLISAVSAFIVQPYLWLVTGIILAVFGVIQFAKYKYHNRGVYGMGTFTIGVFVALGQYLELYIPLASIVVNFIGFICSIPLMVVFYYWKEGQKNVEVRVKREREVLSDNKRTFIQKIRILVRFLQLFKTTNKEWKWSFRLKKSYALLHQEQNYQGSKNAVDFAILQEVTLNRNEYDQTKAN